MRIQPLYEKTGCENKLKARFFYKFNKLLVNTLYPKLVKSEYGVNPDSNIIVSLTSFPARINEVWITIESLLHQSFKPQRVLLWLAEDQFPGGKSELPKSITNLEKYGLEIYFCDNLYSHKKYYYTMLNFPESIVVTVDDDIFYPENLIDELQKLNQKFPNCICCTWAHEITLDGRDIRPYSDWKKHVKEGEKPSLLLVPIGCGGILYPPHALSDEVFSKVNLEKLCPRQDDLWLKSMALLNGTKTVRWSKATPIFFSNMKTQSNGLYHINIGQNNNDISMKSIVEKYPQILDTLASEQHR